MCHVSSIVHIHTKHSDTFKYEVFFPLVVVHLKQKNNTQWWCTINVLCILSFTLLRLFECWLCIIMHIFPVAAGCRNSSAWTDIQSKRKTSQRARRGAGARKNRTRTVVGADSAPPTTKRHKIASTCPEAGRTDIGNSQVDRFNCEAESSSAETACWRCDRCMCQQVLFLLMHYG